jgi:hypothetical protein
MTSVSGSRSAFHSLTPSPEIMEIQLPGDIEKLDGALFPFHRQIESQYKALPWLREIKKNCGSHRGCVGAGILFPANLFWAAAPCYELTMIATANPLLP